MTAINLAEKGLNVVICEKGVVGGEQSGRAYSQIISYKTSPAIFLYTTMENSMARYERKKSVLIPATVFKAALKCLQAKNLNFKSVD